MVLCVWPRAFCVAPFVLALGCGARTGTLGPESRDAGAPWPDARDVSEVRDAMDVSDVREPECSPGKSRECYTGSPETRRLGQCRDGLTTCEPTRDGGFAWGPCIGEVLPTPELCDDADHLCLGHLNPACGCHRDATRRCYSGPVGTEGVGECRAGTQTCVLLSSGPGSTWGPCVGEVLPAAPECDGRDHVCRGAVPSCEVEVRCPDALRVGVNTTVTLTATATATPPTTVTSTRWSVRSSPPASSPRLGNPMGVSAMFSGDTDGVYAVEFTATGSNMRSAACTVTVTVETR